MFEIRQTSTFKSWLKGLKDSQAKTLINERSYRLSAGNPGDAVSIGGGVSELRIHYGPGYRVYFARTGKTRYTLLCGGTKRTQERDVKLAKSMVKS